MNALTTLCQERRQCNELVCKIVALQAVFIEASFYSLFSHTSLLACYLLCVLMKFLLIIHRENEMLRIRLYWYRLLVAQFVLDALSRVNYCRFINSYWFISRFWIRLLSGIKLQSSYNSQFAGIVLYCIVLYCKKDKKTT